jgi:L-asparaginase / beta-aspartyl-peptidase
MSRFVQAIFLLTIMACTPGETQRKETISPKGDITIVVHGGAGTITRGSMTAEKEVSYRQALKAAIDSGYQMLEKGKTSEDVVVAVVSRLEDSPLFNAGKGSVFTNEGTNEMDASIMVGKTLMAGAVAGVTSIRNPIKAAQLVMNRSGHVLLSGKGAELFAKNEGLDIVEPSYFFDSTRYEQWQRIKAKDETSLSEDMIDRKFGTVGCVALDKDGNLAAATSTGGMTNKKFGRIGDSPIIGAGTYANNATCAISSTGHGEYFIRLAIAHDISAMMEYGKATLQVAAESVIMKKLPSLNGTGGVIGLTRAGEVVMTFNTEGMFRGVRRAGQEASISIYND